MILKLDPIPYVKAEPLPKNLLEWYYVVRGSENTPYYGGYYHGMLHFPREFPFTSPAIYMMTPNGPFRTNTRLCVSISGNTFLGADFHTDTWSPTWAVSTVLTGLLNFMLDKTATLGAIEPSTHEKEILAKKSMEYNLKNPKIHELFPEICSDFKKLLNMQIQKKSKEDATAAAAAGDIFALNNINIKYGKGDSIKTVPVNVLKRPQLVGHNNALVNKSTQCQKSALLPKRHSKLRIMLHWLGNTLEMMSLFLFLYIVDYYVKNV